MLGDLGMGHPEVVAAGFRLAPVVMPVVVFAKLSYGKTLGKHPLHQYPLRPDCLDLVELDAIGDPKPADAAHRHCGDDLVMGIGI